MLIKNLFVQRKNDVVFYRHRRKTESLHKERGEQDIKSGVSKDVKIIRKDLRLEAPRHPVTRESKQALI